MESYIYWSYLARPESEGCTFGSEVEERSELSALMVTPQHVDRILKFNFDGEDKSQHFNREASSVDVVSQEDVLRRIKRSSGIVIDHFDEIIELTMDIAHDSDRILDLYNIGFLF